MAYQLKSGNWLIHRNLLEQGSPQGYGERWGEIEQGEGECIGVMVAGGGWIRPMMVGLTTVVQTLSRSDPPALFNLNLCL